MSRGILATCTVRARPGVTAAALRAAYEEAYADEPFLGLLPGAVARDVHDARREHRPRPGRPGRGRRRLVVVAAVDNLAKGTAGGAVQSANLALGLPEELGLTTIGVSP